MQKSEIGPLPHIMYKDELKKGKKKIVNIIAKTTKSWKEMKASLWL